VTGSAVCTTQAWLCAINATHWDTAVGQ